LLTKFESSKSYQNLTRTLEISLNLKLEEYVLVDWDSLPMTSNLSLEHFYWDNKFAEIYKLITEGPYASFGGKNMILMRSAGS